MPFVENFEEFKARQSCECIQVKNDDYEEAWLFANGAGSWRVFQKLNGVNAQNWRLENVTY